MRNRLFSCSHATAPLQSSLKPVFTPSGSSTAGNSSQVSDGAVALTLARRDIAERHDMEILGKWVATSVAGVKPDEMGIGPAVSTPKLLERLGVRVGDVDLWEINEGESVAQRTDTQVIDELTSSSARHASSLRLPIPNDNRHPPSGRVPRQCKGRSNSAWSSSRRIRRETGNVAPF